MVDGDEVAFGCGVGLPQGKGVGLVIYHEISRGEEEAAEGSGLSSQAVDGQFHAVGSGDEGSVASNLLRRD